MKYAFFLRNFTPDPNKPTTFNMEALYAFARTVGEAYEMVLDRVPEGDRVWSWMEMGWESCTLCGGPFHPATGHWESLERHWCGPCTKGMVEFLRDHTKRKWGKVRFYDYATVPTGDTSKEDLNSNAGITQR